MILSIDDKDSYTKDKFETLVQKENIVILDFYADWCGPCKELSPKLLTINEKYKNVKILKINIDENNDMVDKYNIISLPTLVFFYKGKMIHKELGFKEGGKEIVTLISKLIIKEKYENEKNIANFNKEIYNNEIQNKIVEILTHLQN